MGTILPSRLRSPFEHTGEAKVALFPRLPLLAEGSCLPQQTEGLPLRGIPVFRSAYFPIPHRPTFGAPVFRSAYSASRNARASAAFAASIKPYYGLCSKTLDLQVRSAHPPNCTRPAAALNPCTIQDRVSPPPKRCREARRLPDSRGGKGRVKLSPTCTRPAAALNPCTK